ncbi:hypothetical protein CSUI_009115 [Cystoisospora suis]|uniref:Uncharacterized protein n=1 Tax=Cystoisospora suis TaxID=483139 RepID=A0A2C6KL22_9APIC|nr:hypothetical protein CSUI_009115 [Cystoisospora suis]
MRERQGKERPLDRETEEEEKEEDGERESDSRKLKAKKRERRKKERHNKKDRNGEGRRKEDNVDLIRTSCEVDRVNVKDLERKKERKRNKIHFLWILC